MDPIRRCVQALSRLPGIGEKTAWRLTWWLLRTDDSVVTEIAAAVGGLQGSVVECARCCTIATTSPCKTCSDTRRDPSIVCVVERPQDIQAIESSGEYRGLFHVLHGSISPLGWHWPRPAAYSALAGQPHRCAGGHRGHRP